MTTAARKSKTTSDAKKSAKKVVAIESVGVRELRQNASKVLDQVKDGAIIEITEHGVPVARISIKMSVEVFLPIIFAGFFVGRQSGLRAGLIKPLSIYSS